MGGASVALFSASAFSKKVKADDGEKRVALEKDAGGQGTGLDPAKFKPFKIVAVSQYNHDTKLYRVALGSPHAILEMPITSFVLFQAKIDGEDVIRPYTPVDTHGDGVIHFLIKEYSTGKMTKHLSGLKPGDSIDIKGPLPKLPYKPNMKKKISMIAGGTGITPMMQVINAVLANPEDKTELKLIFANVSHEDRLMSEWLDELAANHKNFSVEYVLEKPPKDWTGGAGRVTEELLKKSLPPPSDDSMVLVCGPPGMMKAISGEKTKDFQQGEVDGALKALNYNASQVFKF